MPRVLSGQHDPDGETCRFPLGSSLLLRGLQIYLSYRVSRSQTLQVVSYPRGYLVCFCDIFLRFVFKHFQNFFCCYFSHNFFSNISFFSSFFFCNISTDYSMDKHHGVVCGASLWMAGSGLGIYISFEMARMFLPVPSRLL